MNPINKILERLISTDFADLQGMQLSGTIPLKEQLLNDAIGEVLAGGLPNASVASSVPSAGAAAGPASPSVNLNSLLKFVLRAHVAAHEGQIVLEFEIRR